ncbi:hypothetical protein C7402_14270 [Paraburkholderia unamae]|uniref:Uncharacterized protein n=1 Tax=Paraburkholderia unamae TaxID=219649 RepID=A0ABX5K6W3_9BURK|nr:hypothetical protein C7402_14270 [Paraburkholderia unamae]
MEQMPCAELLALAKPLTFLDGLPLFAFAQAGFDVAKINHPQHVRLLVNMKITTVIAPTAAKLAIRTYRTSRLRA